MFRDIFKNKDCFFRVAKKVRSQKSVGLQGINKHDCCFSLIGGCFTRCLHTTRVAAGVCVCVCFVYFQLKTSPRRHNSRLWRPNGIRELAAAAVHSRHQHSLLRRLRRLQRLQKLQRLRRMQKLQRLRRLQLLRRLACWLSANPGRWIQDSLQHSYSA